MPFLAACAIGLAIGLTLLWLSARAAITVCVAKVEDGELSITRGGIAPRVVADLKDIARRPRVRSGSIRIERNKGRARVLLSGDFDDAQKQQIRNVVGSMPLAKLTNARKKK